MGATFSAYRQLRKDINNIEQPLPCKAAPPKYRDYSSYSNNYNSTTPAYGVNQIYIR